MTEAVTGEPSGCVESGNDGETGDFARPALVYAVGEGESVERSPAPLPDNSNIERKRNRLLCKANERFFKSGIEILDVYLTLTKSGRDRPWVAAQSLVTAVTRR